MSRPAALVALILAAGALAAGAAALPSPALAQKAQLDLPGVDVSALTPDQQEVVRKVVDDEFCYCGCPHTLAGCLREHRSCKHAPRMAALTVRLAGQGMRPNEILKTLTTYYAGFDSRKRAHLEVKGFGPPLGRTDAPITLVEFSDFACPYCQAVRPELERFVQANEARLKLFYKPFPIAGHPRAVEAAMAGEWARDKGLFWRMHDQLFDHPHDHSDEQLAAAARAVGGDAADLREALASGRYRTRLAASQAEARNAGLQGTPTFYVNGRMLVLPSAPQDIGETLRFAIEDEEEWSKHGGWAKD